MNGVNTLLNRYDKILVIVILIGILLLPAVSAGKISNFGQDHWTNMPLPAVNYIPTSSSTTLYQNDTGIKEPVCTPVKMSLTNNNSDYPLFLRAKSVGDIAYLIMDVNPKIKSQAEAYFIQVTRSEYCAENPSILLIGGWIYPDRISKVSNLPGVTLSLMIWPPYGYESMAGDPPAALFPISYDPIIDPNTPVTRPVENTFHIPQISVQPSKNFISSGSLISSQFRMNHNPINPLGPGKSSQNRTICSLCSY